MSTHNLLLPLGEAIYLEVIAINPGAAKPSRPRWFALDELAQDAKPNLAGWVARTEDIRQSTAAASEALGRIELMSRGALEWLITVPEDGSLPLGGVAPALIQWHTHTHPASNMQGVGCTLVALDLWHPQPRRVSALLEGVGFTEPGVLLSVQYADAPGLAAHIQTPEGLRRIGAPNL